MLEAKFSEGTVFKKLIESFKDLITDANFEFSAGGMSLQSMDSTHVVLVMMLMRADGFERYRCDRTMPIGVNLNVLSKIVKCAGNDDSITIRADDGGETINFVFESGSGERVSDYDLKLLDLDVECLGVEEEETEATLVIPSDELQRICRDLSNLSETVEIEVVKDAVRFTAKGELGSGSVQLKSSSSVAAAAPAVPAAKKAPKIAVDEEDEEEDEAATEDPTQDSLTAPEVERKRSRKEAKEAKDANNSAKDAPGTTITMRKPVSLSVSLKFLSAFCKATSLSPTVRLVLTDKQPMMVEYVLGEVGYVRFYLAPKIGDDE